MFCLGFIWCKVDFFIIFWKYRHRVLVVINVCYSSFSIVFSSSPINNKFYRPSSVALLYSIIFYWAICMFLKLFYWFIIWWPIESRMCMSGVGTLCAYAHYPASLFNYTSTLAHFVFIVFLLLLFLAHDSKNHVTLIKSKKAFIYINNNQSNFFQKSILQNLFCINRVNIFPPLIGMNKTSKCWQNNHLLPNNYH